MDHSAISIRFPVIAIPYLGVCVGSYHSAEVQSAYREYADCTFVEW